MCPVCLLFLLFQSTLLQEERHCTGSAEHVGIVISIHAPTRGATTEPINKPQEKEISIHAPTRGATYICGQHGYTWIISIHAPTRGATLVIMLENKHYKFQSTLLQEERHGSKESKKTKAPISIHAPTRGATADALQNKPE